MFGHFSLTIWHLSRILEWCIAPDYFAPYGASRVCGHCQTRRCPALNHCAPTGLVERDDLCDTICRLLEHPPGAGL